MLRELGLLVHAQKLHLEDSFGDLLPGSGQALGNLAGGLLAGALLAGGLLADEHGFVEQPLCGHAGGLLDEGGPLHSHDAPRFACHGGLVEQLLLAAPLRRAVYLGTETTLPLQAQLIAQLFHLLNGSLLSSERSLWPPPLVRAQCGPALRSLATHSGALGLSRRKRRCSRLVVEHCSLETCPAVGELNHDLLSSLGGLKVRSPIDLLVELLAQLLNLLGRRLLRGFALRETL
mmetsp:Transcript_93099/g.199679  ORF Transcript_93099/g.199679 Transcript_93099/m.199679 type:complete len:233 (+) Transcript_93099:900-1598(+)